MSAEGNSGITPGGSEMPGEQESVETVLDMPLNEKEEALDVETVS